jgi:very-short-patch-repair endonuclease
MKPSYPVVKIPPLLTSLKPVLIESTQLEIVKPTSKSSIDAVSKSTEPVINDRSKRSRRNYYQLGYGLGYGLLFISTLIFAVAVARDLPLLLQAGIIFSFGIAIINTVSLFPLQQIKEDRETSKQSSIELDREVITKTVEIIPVDFPKLLAGKVMAYGAKATAQVGVSEPQFERHLNRYFPDLLHPGYEFTVSGKYKYSSDFTLILANGISLIVEIDEPYVGNTKKPHHCTDEGKDDRRDAFFLKGNWVVIRFSEFQVCTYPIECCHTIAQVIDAIDLSSDLSKQFKGVERLPNDPRWTMKMARSMARQNYRRTYLKEYN